MATSPTARSLAECKRRGWTAQVVERYNQYARRRIDLFGVIDIVAMSEKRIVGIQATSSSNHSSHREKIMAEPRALEWIQSGGSLVLWSWGKKGERGKRKRWQLLEEVITADMFEGPCPKGGPHIVAGKDIQCVKCLQEVRSQSMADRGVP